MVSDTTSTRRAGKPPHADRRFGSALLGSILPKVTRAAYRKQAPARAMLMAEWPLIVGPALSEMAFPRRFAAGTLTLGCAGSVALELQHLAPMLMERINHHLGHDTVIRLRFVQEAARASGVGPRPRPSLQPIAIEGLPEGGLRNALASLGAAVANDPA